MTKEKNFIERGYERLFFENNENEILLKKSTNVYEKVKFSRGRGGKLVKAIVLTSTTPKFDREYFISWNGKVAVITGYPGTPYGGNVTFSSLDSKSPPKNIEMSIVKLDSEEGKENMCRKHLNAVQKNGRKKISLEEAAEIYGNLVSSIKSSDY